MFDWIIGGTIYSLDDKTNYYTLGHTGTGMMPVTRLSERGPLQIGVTDRGYILSDRTIVLSMGIRGNSLEDLYTKRTALLNIMKPGNIVGILRWTLGSTVREIKAYYVGDSLGFENSSREYLWQTVGVALKCPDPRWYDPISKIVDATLGASDVLEVPMEIPMVVGASVIDFISNFTYQGSAPAFPIITIKGPVNNLVITHVQTGFKLDFTGATIATGDYYVINLEYGFKQILDQDGVVKNSDLTNDSDLVLWSLLPAPDVPSGINSIKITGDGADAGTNISMVWNNRYMGI